jgi:hypothetical protein
MSEGESDAMEAYEEEEIETDARGRKIMPSIDRLAREAIVNRWRSNRAVHSFPYAQRGTETSGLVRICTLWFV